MEITEELINKVSSYAREHEKESRYSHSLRVAETGRYMCGLYGLDGLKGYFAGLAHDICKDMGEENMTALCRKEGWDLSEDEIQFPSLIHGKAAAVVLKDDFGVDDPEILEAVAFHTLGSPEASDLAKVVFAADKIEPGRPHSTDEYRKRLFSKTLDELVLSVLEESFDYLKSKNKSPAAVSLEFAAALRASLEKSGSVSAREEK